MPEATQTASKSGRVVHWEVTGVTVRRTLERRLRQG